MYVYGQLLNAQLENSAGNPSSGGTPLGRMYIDDSNAAAAIPKFYNGSYWANFGAPIVTNNNTGTVVFNTNGNSETVYNTGGSTLASLAITLPATSQPGQILRYVTKPAVTSASVTASGTLAIGAAVTSLSALASISYQAVDTAGTFIRLT